MTKLITAIFAALLVTVASAATPPESITFDAKAGKVTFPHKAHSAKGCKTCHEGAPGKIAGFNKDKAHELCKGCHAKEAKGPTKCDGCHKK
ncbi:MAG TPA: cytochrome c3 family protein [Anaeromyxobacteraceae bacterium]|nr:cytochrome c3 family protein [Anaeromyxobacteraceae bacterium]